MHPSEPAPPPTSVAVVGCGAVADRYLDGLLADPTLRVVAAADRDVDRAARVADRADCPAFDGAAAAVADADAAPDLVVNLTSHAAHAPVTRTALEAGCHVFSEKPLADGLAAARDLLALARDCDRRLGCAPLCHVAPTGRRLRRLLAEGRVGRPRHVDARCHVGRVTEWHDDPDSFLRVGPLYDAGVYPLTLLTAAFGPVRRVRAADRLRLRPPTDGEDDAVPDAPDHAVATLTLGDRPAGARRAADAGSGRVTVQLSASTYVPHRTREFVACEVHGDGGSAYVADAGATDRGARDRLRLAPLGSGYGPVPVQGDGGGLVPADGPADLAAAARAGRPSPVDAGRAAHVVAAVDAIRRAAETGGPVDVPDVGDGRALADAPDGTASAADGRAPLRADPWPTASTPAAAPDALALPPVGFGCSRYRGEGKYVDLDGPIRTAVDAGCRLFDAAELYGTESTIREALARPGAPDREAVTLVSKLWNTNHAPERVRPACEASLDRLGVDRLDVYMLHWPDAWVHRGPLEGVADLSHEALEALAFPTDEDGDPLTADVDLAGTWAAMEALVDDGLVDALGICNVDRATLADLRADARRPPAVVQVESHPYRPRDALVDWCHNRGLRVVAHSPLSASGLLDEPALRAVADRHGRSPAQVALRFHVDRGVVPVPSSTDPAHVVDNLDVFGFALDADDRDRLASLRDPGFER